MEIHSSFIVVHKQKNPIEKLYYCSFHGAFCSFSPFLFYSFNVTLFFGKILPPHSPYVTLGNYNITFQRSPPPVSPQEWLLIKRTLINFFIICFILKKRVKIQAIIIRGNKNKNENAMIVDIYMHSCKLLKDHCAASTTVFVNAV